MRMPFTPDQFLEIFRRYNESVWPMQILLFLLAISVIYLAIKPRISSSHYISVILVFFWFWMGILYHILIFTSINLAAYIFGILFIIQGIIFLYAGRYKNLLSFRFSTDWYGITGALLIIYSIFVYPAIGYLLGHVYPESPTFGLPCPTVIFTFGILLWTDKRIPWYILIIPTLWAFIGFFAALNLAIYEDIGLLVASVLAVSLIIAGNNTRSSYLI